MAADPLEEHGPSKPAMCMQAAKAGFTHGDADAHALLSRAIRDTESNFRNPEESVAAGGG